MFEMQTLAMSQNAHILKYCAAQLSSFSRLNDDNKWCLPGRCQMWSRLCRQWVNSNDFHTCQHV